MALGSRPVPHSAESGACRKFAQAAPGEPTPDPDLHEMFGWWPLGAGLGLPRPTGVEMISDVDVVIAGAGPTGLLLAGDLARAGVNCAVFERRPGRSGLTRAFTVHSRTLEHLDARGVGD